MPDPPYYAVIFTSRRSSSDESEYARVAEQMAEWAAQQPGYLGMMSLRDDDGLGVTISYWSDGESIENWRGHTQHRLAQQQGRETFYDDFRVEVCLIERSTVFERELDGSASTDDHPNLKS